MSVILFFIDGLGIGERGSSNPMDGLERIEPLAHFGGERNGMILDGVVIPTDACLGVEGRPQSASGQTTILTGINAPAQLGYHKQGFPNEELRTILREHSIFVQCDRYGLGPAIFANAYRPIFFELRPRWVSATTTAVEAAGGNFRTIDDLREGRAVYHDFTNATLIEKGFDLPRRSPTEAAHALAHISEENRFTLYEHFITDRIGHSQDREAARKHLPLLAQMIRELLASVDLAQTTVVLTSDHGNIEDLSSRSHTLNPVPTLIWGQYRDEVAGRIRSLSDITPAILEVLRQHRS